MVFFLSPTFQRENVFGTESLKTIPNWFHWSDLPDFPNEIGVAGAFIGNIDGRIVVAGGSNFPVPKSEGGTKKYENRIFVLEKKASGQFVWSPAGHLPKPLAHGDTVTLDNGILCLGGENEQGTVADVFLLRYNPVTKTIETDSNFPPLPDTRSYFATAIHQNRVYLAGGKNQHGEAVATFWSIALDQLKNKNAVWKSEKMLPGKPRFGAALLRQNKGDRDVLFLLGGKSSDGEYLTDAFSYDPHQKEIQPWKPICPISRPIVSAPAIAWGQSHLLVFGGSDGRADYWLQNTQNQSAFPNTVLAYHTITDTWCVCGTMSYGTACTKPIAFEKGILLPSGEIKPTIRTPQVIRADFIPMRTNFALGDYLALTGYFVGLTFFGYFLAGWKKTSNDFLIGKRRIPWWAAALSLLATQVSSIGVMSIPAKSYATDWSYFIIVGVWFLVVPIVTTIYIPFFRSLKITSAYEYLEFRFHWTVRLLATIIYSMMQLGRMAIVLYLPALALVAVTGIDPKICIILMGIICTVYTFMGGLEAVIWIDVIQAVLLIGGMILCVATIFIGIDGGFGTFCTIAWNDNKFALGDLSFDPTIACVWVLLIGNFFTRFGGLTSDQAIVQRYLTTPTDQAAKRSLWGDVFLSIPWAILVFSFGTALYVFFKINPVALNPTLDTDGIVPYYIAAELTTPGLAGLIIAAIFAAAMSTFDGAIHSVATIWVVDVYARFFPKNNDETQLWMARLFTFSLGIFGTGMAIALTMFNIRSLWDSFFAITGLLVGGLSGLFILAMFTKRTGSIGAVAGVIGSAVILWLIVHYTNIHFFLYSAIGCAICVTIGYFLSFLVPNRRNITEFTVFRKKNS
ncbi:MAG: sodium/solute symporter [Planctomycetaceae bacterium]|jgi:SSS family transporter|nr:sodium/solute symporter [Planctomycetaceae bacterium]